jgi:glycine cleavage system H protein
MNIPSDLLYTSDHEWIRTEGKTARVGITDFAQGELGDIVFVEIETVGSQLKQGSTFGTIEAVKTVSDLLLPVDAKVLEVNPMVHEKPELINKDPYGDGWLIAIEINNPEQLNGLMNASAYESLINA